MLPATLNVEKISNSKAIAVSLVGFATLYVFYRFFRLRWIRLFYHPVKLHCNFAQMPSVLPYFPNILLLALFKSEGKDYFGQSTNVTSSSLSQPSQLSVGIKSIHINPNHLKSYIKCTNFPIKNNKDSNCKSDELLTLPLPLCYFEGIRFPFTAQLVTYNEFPVSPFGLIHTKTEIKQYNKRISQLLLKQAGSDDTIDRLSKLDLKIETHLGNMIDTPKGIEIDIITLVFCNNNKDNINDDSLKNTLIYHCKETVLSRNMKKLKKFKQTAGYKTRQEKV